MEFETVGVIEERVRAKSSITLLHREFGNCTVRKQSCLRFTRKPLSEVSHDHNSPDLLLLLLPVFCGLQGLISALTFSDHGHLIPGSPEDMKNKTHST